MTLVTVLLQTALPLLLLAGMATMLASAGWRFALGALAVASAILAISLTTIHAYLPAWLPLLWAAIWSALVLARVHGSGRPRRARDGWTRGAILVVSVALGLYGLVLWPPALLGRSAPEDAVVDLPMPLAPGMYLVAHGGTRAAVNPHMKTLDESVPRFAAYRGQSHAVDLLGYDPRGALEGRLQTVDPSTFPIFGTPVHAPCAGVVRAAANDMSDNPVPVMNRTRLEGNFVLIDCGAFDVLLAHFREGHPLVGTGARVTKGAYLGDVGNSGASSAPHLHIHVQRAGSDGSPFSGTPLHLRLGGHLPVRNDRLSGRDW